MFSWAKRKPSTFFKYLFSYVFAFTVLIFGFFLVLRSQLAESYKTRQAERVSIQMEAARLHLHSEFLFLFQTDNMILANPDIRMVNFQQDSKLWMQTRTELDQYASSSTLIASIIYHSQTNAYVFSTSEYVTVLGDIYSIRSLGKQQISFDPAPYMDATAGQLIWLEEENVDTRYLLWFPVNRSHASYLYFYTLDTREILAQLNTMLSNEVLAVAMLDGNGSYVIGTGFDAYQSVLDSIKPEYGFIPLEDGASLYISKPMQDGFMLAAIISGDALREQANEAFFRSYLSILVLSFIGIVLVYLAMRYTYKPLQTLVASLGHESGRDQNYLELIAQHYSEINHQKAKLEQTLAEYRESIAQNPGESTDELAYPHEELGQLSILLRGKNFAQAHQLLDSLLLNYGSSPGYFLGCILLDYLTIITNSMAKANIEYDHYSTIFTEAVYKCRNISQAQNSQEIQGLLCELLILFEKEIVIQRTQLKPLQQIVEENFCDPNFSIVWIAEAYHVSVSRMSGLFKEEMGSSFLEYVWKKRQEKAEALLRETDLSVDEISFQVGYLASTSFHRKFKQETGLTPLQYRNQLRKTNDEGNLES